MLSKIANLFKTIFSVAIKAISEPVKTPFQNIKTLVIINKMLGLISCRFVNGQFRQSTIWGRGFCALWILIHCAYSCAFYYVHFFITSAEEGKTLKDFVLDFVRFNIFIISLLPYNYMAVFHWEEFVKFSEKLEEYDDRAKVLQHERKDKNIFTWLYFVYTFMTITLKSYFVLEDAIREGAMKTLQMTFFIVIPIVCGTYCVFITVIFLDLTRQRFRHLNEEIIPYVSRLPVTGSPGAITIYDVRYLHGVLINSAKFLDSVYGVGTLITFGSILLECIANIYTIVKDLQKDEIVTSLDLFFQAIYLLGMYHFTTYEANRVEERVIQYGLSSRNKQYRLERIETMLYFYHNRFSFSAAGFFIVDLTLLLSVVSTAATNITLLV